MTKTFVNPMLQKIDNEAQTIIANHLNDLKRASEDIKALENSLREAAIPFSFRYKLTSCEVSFEEPAFQIDWDVQYEYLGSFIKKTEECLEWIKDSNNKARLFYNVYKTVREIKNVVEYGKQRETILHGKEVLESSRPLIETRSQLRLKFETELPVFYHKIIEALKTQRNEECIVVLSPNFVEKLIKPVVINEDDGLPF